MLATPVRDAQGRMTGSLQLPLDLLKFKLLGTDKISDNTVLGVIDQRGTMVARSLQPEKFIGRNLMASSEIVRAVVETQRGTQVARSSEGVERIYGFVPIESTPWFAIAGVSADSVLGEVRLEAGRSCPVEVVPDRRRGRLRPPGPTTARTSSVAPCIGREV